MGALSTTALAAIALVVGLILRKRAIGGDAVVWFFFAAGVGLAGLLGEVLTNIGSSITRATAHGTETLTGAAVPAVAAIGLTLWMFIDMAPKTTTSRVAPWIALIVPSVWAAAGGMWAELDGTANNLLAEAGTSMTTFFESIVVGW